MASVKSLFITRGAEAEIYKADFFGLMVVIKKRVSKLYRNPVFDKVFIQSRTRIEAKVLSELYNAGLRVPAVLFVDEDNGVIIMEYIEGVRLSNIFENLDSETLIAIGARIGKFAALMHNMNIYHGDFTIANIIFTDREVVVIDFGLAGYSTDIEEYAIDLHLMSRSAYAADPDKAEIFEKTMLNEYTKSYAGDSEEVIKRMREIRVRGRYVDRELRKSIMRERYVG